MRQRKHHHLNLCPEKIVRHSLTLVRRVSREKRRILKTGRRSTTSHWEDQSIGDADWRGAAEEHTGRVALLPSSFSFFCASGTPLPMVSPLAHFFPSFHSAVSLVVQLTITVAPHQAHFWRPKLIYWTISPKLILFCLFFFFLFAKVALAVVRSKVILIEVNALILKYLKWAAKS